jgi:hypothetical protein
MPGKRAIFILLLIVLAISIPLAFVIRAKIDLDITTRLRSPERAAQESASLPEPDVVLSDEHPLVPVEGLLQDR